MHFGALLQSIIYVISSTLLYPAMSILVLSFVIIIMSCGSVLAEWADRARKEKLNPRTRGAVTGTGLYPGRLGTVLDELQEILGGESPAWEQVEALWQDTRLRLWKKLDYLRILVRLGPSLGLMCTLIPMTTGLAALSQGDMSRLSSDLVIAFSTTVVGLAVGVTAYLLYTVRARWLEGDLELLQLVMENRAAAVLDADRRESL